MPDVWIAPLLFVSDQSFYPFQFVIWKARYWFGIPIWSRGLNKRRKTMRTMTHFSRSAQQPKKRTNRDTLYHQLGVILWYNVPLFFDRPFLKAMAEILKQNPLGFLVYLKTPRSSFEIKWPLMVYWASSWIFQNRDPSLNWDIEIISTKFSNGFSESHTWFTGHSFQSGGYWSCS
mgnify:CR=1 FL=1